MAATRDMERYEDRHAEWSDDRHRRDRRSARRRQVRRRRLGAALLLGVLTCALLILAMFLTGCGSGDQVRDAGPITTTDGAGGTVDDGGVASPTTSPTDDSGGNGGDGQTSTTVTAVSSNDTMQISVYFARGEKIAAAHRSIPRTKEVGAAAMRELLEGPNSREVEDARMATAIPGSTAFLGLNIRDGVATVDLSREFASGGGTLSMTLRIAQVVYTLTQFSSVERVAFQLDGEPVDTIGGEGLVVDPPVSRADYESVTPAILVESPTVGDDVASPMRVQGTSNVFEATSQINVVDEDGRVIAEKTVTATSGSGTRGSFDVLVPFEVSQAQAGALVVFEYSAKDGSKINEVEIPLDLKP